MKLSVIKEALTKVWQSSTTRALLFVSGIFLVKTVFAEDVLGETTGDLKDTYNGSIKTYVYVFEALAAILGLIVTRKITVLLGIGAIALFLNVVAKLAHLV